MNISFLKVLFFISCHVLSLWFYSYFYLFNHYRNAEFCGLFQIGFLISYSCNANFLLCCICWLPSKFMSFNSGHIFTGWGRGGLCFSFCESSKNPVFEVSLKNSFCSGLCQVPRDFNGSRTQDFLILLSQKGSPLRAG